MLNNEEFEYTERCTVFLVCVGGGRRRQGVHACREGRGGGGGEVSKFSKMLLDPESPRILAIFF